MSAIFSTEISPYDYLNKKSLGHTSCKDIYIKTREWPWKCSAVNSIRCKVEKIHYSTTAWGNYDNGQGPTFLAQVGQQSPGLSWIDESKMQVNVKLLLKDGESNKVKLIVGIVCQGLVTLDKAITPHCMSNLLNLYSVPIDCNLDVFMVGTLSLATCHLC